MPTTAQDRVGRGPFAALLILLSLFLSSGTAATAGQDLRAPARLAPSRHAAAAVVPSGIRNPSDDEPLGTGADPSVPPSAPSVVTDRLWARPATRGPSAAWAAVPRPAAAAYRARAPPAS